MSDEPNEQLPKDKRHKAVARADRRLLKYERESRFLNKMSEDYQVFDDVFDISTLLAINELRGNGIIQYIMSSLAAGKESKVYLAVAPDGSFRALKIYLTVSAEFKKRMQYLVGDPRFSNIKPGSRNLIKAWARKEFKNLQTAHASGVLVPLPIAVRKNLLVMEFIGDSEGNSTTTLLDTEDITSDDYLQVIEQLKILYQKAKLVHADLSEYNIFKTKSGIMLFDFGSAISIQHPNSKQFLVRDVLNINKFFEKQGIGILDTALVVEKIRDQR
ncbi:MAG: serine protein kinase RIO [Thermoproteota archaeon]|nr:serine protein kinase RIO [Thermoproteota archaeon]